MRRSLALLFLGTSLLFAQRGQRGPGGGMPPGARPGPAPAPPTIRYPAPAARQSFSTGGYGNVVFPGTGGPPPVGSIVDPGFGSRLSATVQGRPYGYGYSRPAPHGGGGRQVVIPYAYPVVIGGFDSYYNQSAMPPAEPAYTAPTVVINQTYTPDVLHPSVREYSEGALPESTMKTIDGIRPAVPEPPPAPAVGPMPTGNPAAEAKATIYLIAYRDGSVYQALGYWYEGETLNYVTPRGNINRATMDLIDRETSEKLNQERGVEFSLKR